MATRRPNGAGQFDGPFVALPKEMLDSASYRQLGAIARCVLIELAGAHNGFNNGKIIASQRWLAGRLGCRQSTVARALAELVAGGFVRVARPSAFTAKRVPALYELTCYQCDGQPPTKDYLRVCEIQTIDAYGMRHRCVRDARIAYRCAYASMIDAPTHQSIDLRATRRSRPPRPVLGVPGGGACCRRPARPTASRSDSSSQTSSITGTFLPALRQVTS